MANTVETPHGPARVHLENLDRGPAVGLLALGHGAGGGVEAPDLLAARDAALALGFAVARVEQPYRVAGRRAPAPASQLDAAWRAVINAIRPSDTRLIVGGRSSGARVACRTARESGASAVLCLAFPLHPPGRPEKSRLDELDGVGVPVLVVQGERDPFGTPPARAGRTVVPVPGTHSLRDAAAVAAAVTQWMSSPCRP